MKPNLRLKEPSSHTRLLSRVAIGDVLWGGLSPLAAYLLRDGIIARPAAVATYCVIGLLVSLLVFQWFRTSSPISRFYSMRDALELLKACVLIAALSAVAAFLLTRLGDAPRSIPILHFMLLTSGLLGARILLRLHNARREAATADAAQTAEHVLIIQASRLAWFFSRMIEELAPGAYQIVAILDERQQLKHRSLSGYPVIGMPADLDKVVAEYATHGVRIDTVLLAVRPEELSAASWNKISRVCRTSHINLEVLPERLTFGHTPANDDGVVVAPADDDVATQTSPQVRLDSPFWKIKRGIDFVVTLSLAVLSFPVAVVVCLLVVVDVGIPVVFWQRRVGRNGAALYLYKFRTLQAPFDRRTKEKRRTQDISACGRFLRTTRLDEWPQLWNVLSGDMSLIGPRPLLPEDQPKDLSLRLTVRPGVTGWAQVCGGKLISPEEKKALDEWYIRHASPVLDLIILRRTVLTLFAGDRRDEASISAALLDQLHSQLARKLELGAAVAAE